MLRPKINNYIHKINIMQLAQNENLKSLSILQQNINTFDKIYFNHRCGWHHITENSNYNIISILKQNIDKLDIICWRNLSSNPLAMNILEQNIDKLDIGGGISDFDLKI